MMPSFKSQITNITSEEKDEVITYTMTTLDGMERQVPVDPMNIHYEAILEWLAENS